MVHRYHRYWVEIVSCKFLRVKHYSNPLRPWNLYKLHFFLWILRPEEGGKQEFRQKSRLSWHWYLSTKSLMRSRKATRAFILLVVSFITVKNWTLTEKCLTDNYYKYFNFKKNVHLEIDIMTMDMKPKVTLKSTFTSDISPSHLSSTYMQQCKKVFLGYNPFQLLRKTSTAVLWCCLLLSTNHTRHPCH